MEHEKQKPSLFLTFDMLPESIKWQIGKVYRVKMVLKQTSTSEDGANFEVVDASSLEQSDKHNRTFMSEGGFFKG